MYSYRNINDIKEVVTNYDSEKIEKIEKMGIQLHSNYIKENWRIYFASKEYVDAIFVKPRNIDPPFKTILFNHSHGGNYDLGKKELIQGNYYLEHPTYAEALTQKRYAVFAFDAMGFGSRKQKSEGYLFKQLIMEGEVMWFKMVGESLAVIKFLANSSDVLGNEIATIGMSMGGVISYWLAALSPYIHLSVDICGMVDYHKISNSEALEEHGLYFLVPNIKNVTDTLEINKMIFPKYHMTLVGKKDQLVPLGEVIEIEKQVRKLYESCDLINRYKVFYSEDAHIETMEMRQAVLKFVTDNF